MTMYFIFNVILFATFSLTNGIESYRLSRSVKPLHYTIQIQPDIDKNIFYGSTLIYVYTETILEEITLHSQNLSISDVYINHRKGVVRFHEDEKISVSYENENIEPGTHYIFFNYSGIIFEDKGGFIKAPFGYEDIKMYVYVTDLEPCNARKVFPCFDEPYFKATFSIKLIAPEDYKAISNMLEIGKFSTTNNTIYVFETSVKMSTYLVSFAFTKFPYYEGKLEMDGNTWPIKIYSLNASRVNNEYAIECSKEALQFYSKYTNISYPLPKLDMIEYERTRTAATENWGLITFKKGLLSYSLNIYSKSQIQLVIYHELGHFWFGNLVTNDWWNDLWLQEGFAVYMSYKLLAKKNGTPQIYQMKSFEYDDYLNEEYVNNSNAVVSHISQQENIFQTFDNLVYNKGAAILLMLEEVIGEDKFELIIKTFLQRYAYRTATTNDFISIVEEIIANQPLRSFLESYLYQNKFPLITIEDKNGTFILRQSVCQSSSLVPTRNTWTIPITYITDKNNLTNQKLVWFDRDMDKLEIVEPDIKWIIFNPKRTGIYETQLSANMWKNLLINFEEIGTEGADAVISNALQLLQYNLANCNIIIDFIKQSKNKEKLFLFEKFHLFLYTWTCATDIKFKQAASIYYKFIQEKFNTYNFMNGFCGSEEFKIDENLKQCAEWIIDNLPSTTNDINKYNIKSYYI